MEITSPTAPAPRPDVALAPEADKGAANISADFEAFLRMLTVQMKNQDPLNPVNSTDFAVQLATFSNVEQQVQTNDLLRDMIGAISTGGMAELANWVGKEARAAVPGHWNGRPITVSPNPEQGATAARLVVIDEDGTEVQRITIPVSARSFEWNGLKADGTPFAHGLYSFEVESLNGDSVTSRDMADVYSRVTEVQALDGITKLILAGGASVAADEVNALRDPSLQ